MNAETPIIIWRLDSVRTNAGRTWTVAHCLWNAPTAECQNQLPPDQRGHALLLRACQPSPCRDSLLPLAHERIWRMEETDLVVLLNKTLPKPLREQALTRLAEVARRPHSSTI